LKQNKFVFSNNNNDHHLVMSGHYVTVGQHISCCEW